MGTLTLEVGGAISRAEVSDIMKGRRTEPKGWVVFACYARREQLPSYLVFVGKPALSIQWPPGQWQTLLRGVDNSWGLIFEAVFGLYTYVRPEEHMHM